MDLCGFLCFSLYEHSTKKHAEHDTVTLIGTLSASVVFVIISDRGARGFHVSSCWFTEIAIFLQVFYSLKMNSKSYAEVVSSSSDGESICEPSNTFWRKYQVEDETDATKRAIENSMICGNKFLNDSIWI